MWFSECVVYVTPLLKILATACMSQDTPLLYTRCGAGIGMALWILESYVVLLDATDVYNVKGCTVTPPYLDK